MATKYRVLLVCSHPVPYTSPVLRQMAQHSDLDIQVAYCSLQGAEPGTDPEFGIEVQWDVPLLEGYPWVQVPNKSPRPGLGRFFGLCNLGLWKLVRAGAYDAVIVYTGYAYASFWIVAAAAKLCKTALLFGTDATGLEPRSRNHWKIWLKKMILPHVFQMATVAIAPSPATAEYLQLLRVPEDRIVVTPFVVDNTYWLTRAEKVNIGLVRSSWGCSEDKAVVLFCAKFQPWKRPQDVLRAFAKLGVLNAVLIMAGDGPMRAALEAETKTLNVTSRVRFVGFVNQTELPALYRSADVMVLPSEYDACPVVVCEAMLCGCPIILSDKVRGRLELVRPEHTGFIYPCGDVNALAATLGRALSERNKLRQMGEAGRHRMETWSPRENVTAHVEAIERAVRLTRNGASA
jgi:glycosyltransferase involved in cell wall biosynthesis